MTVYCLESSALFKRYKSEPGSDLMAEFFDSKRPGEVFITSHLTVLEINSVAARLLRGSAILPRQYDGIVGTFVSDLFNYGVIVLPLQDGLVTEALALLPGAPLRTADALHFAAALRAKQGAAGEPFVLVSADREIVGACDAHGVPCLNPKLPTARDLLRSLRSG